MRSLYLLTLLASTASATDFIGMTFPPYPKVTHSLPYPDVPEGYSLALGTCQVNGEDDQTIVAVVRDEASEWLNSLLWVRRFDLDKEVFVEQPAGRGSVPE